MTSHVSHAARSLATMIVARRINRLALALGLALTLMGAVFVGLGPLTTVRAQALFTVVNINDSGPGSLRQAILDANAAPGVDVIDITATGTVNLQSALPAITGSVSLQGPGASLFRVDGQDLYRVFDIVGVTATLADLTVQHGSAPGVSEDGGAIRSNRALTLTAVHVLSSTAAGDGGGLYVAGDLIVTGSHFRNNRSTGGVAGALRSIGAAAVSNTQFLDNTSQGDGGAMHALELVTLTDVILQGNRCLAASCDGGALYAFSRADLRRTEVIANAAGDQGGGASVAGRATITDVRFQDNRALNGTGGGLFAQGVGEIIATQFLSNTARSNGGGLYALAAVTVTNGLFEGNQSTLGLGGGVAAAGSLRLDRARLIRNSAVGGGGLYQALFDADIVNSLFAENSASGANGAALLMASAGAVDIAHTTIAAPSASSGSAIQVVTGTAVIANTVIASHAVGLDVAGGAVTQDFNLFFGNGSDVQGNASGGANNAQGDPRFAAPLGDDYRLAPGSAALDVGTAVGVATDFDGETRPQGSGFDIGFDEFAPWRTLLPIVLR